MNDVPIPHPTTDEHPATLHRSTVLLMSVATGLTVASLYYCQPLLHEMSSGLGISDAAAGLLVTFTQVGYALGLFFVIPLGDLLERRGLIVTMSLGLVAALLLVAVAPTGAWLFGASLLVGVLSVLAQVLVPLAATLALPAERGRVVGTVMSGLLLGILLARTVAGALAELGGWRSVYVVAAVLMLALTLALRRGLPRSPAPVATSYLGLLRSVGQLVRAEPVLRRRMLYGALVFAQFSVLWTALTGLLVAAPYNYSEAIIGLFGLVGAAGALSAQFAGRHSDKGHTLRLATGFAILLAVSWVAMAAGRDHLLPLIVGIIALDLGVQGVHVSNQSQIYAIPGEARARVNSAYMTTYFIGGSLGSWAATRVAAHHGWSGVCVLGGAISVALVVAIVAGETTLRPVPRRP